MKLRELSTAIDKALDVGSSVTGATGLGAAAAQAVPKLKSVAAKVVPGANIAYQAIDTAKRAKAGDVVGAGIAAASANPVGMWVGPAVQALRDKVRTGSYFPSDEEIQAAVAKDKKAGGYWKSRGSDFDPSYMPENQEQDAVATNARTRRLLNQIKGQFPQAQNDIEALLLYIDATNQVDRVDINRLDQENDQEEADIARIDTEVDAIQKTTKSAPKVSEVLNPAMSFEEYSPFMKEVSKPLKIKIKHPPMTAQEKLYKRQQELRKKSGLPDPQYYKDLGEKLRKELEDLRREEPKESLRPGEYHHFETDPKTGKRVYKGIRFDRVGGGYSDRQGDEQERRDRDERAMRQYDRRLPETEVNEISNFGKNIFFKIADNKLDLAKQVQKAINFHMTKKPGVWKFSVMKNQSPAKVKEVIDQLTKYFGKPIDINKVDKIQEADVVAQAKLDPQKLIARVFIDGESKDYDLTGMFKGDVKSQLNQASEFITNRLEASGIDYSNLELYYQGARLRVSSVGNVNIGAVRENDVVDQAMARYKSPEMKAQSQAIDKAFASGDEAEFKRLGIQSPQQIERDYQAMLAKEPEQDAALLRNPKLTPSARSRQKYNPKGVPIRERNVDEAGPFSYGAKKPRKGSVADLAAKKRKEQEKGRQPAEPKDHMVGVARVVKELDVRGASAGDQAAYDQYAQVRAKGDILDREASATPSPVSFAGSTQSGFNQDLKPKTQVAQSQLSKDLIAAQTTGLAAQNPEMEKRYTMNKLAVKPTKTNAEIAAQLESQGVADLAAKKRKEQDKNYKPIEPKNQMVGTAKIVKEFVPGDGSDNDRRITWEQLVNFIRRTLDSFGFNYEGSRGFAQYSRGREALTLEYDPSDPGWFGWALGEYAGDFNVLYSGTDPLTIDSAENVLEYVETEFGFKNKNLDEGGFDIPEIPRAPQPRPVPKDNKIGETDNDKDMPSQVAKDIEYIKKQGYGKLIGKIAIPKILKLIRDEKADWDDDDLPESDHHMGDENMHKFNGEYDDEAGMAHTNLITIARAADDLLDTIDENENLPEWVQEKIAKVEGMLVSVWDYLKSQEAQGIDPRIMETYARLAEDWQKVNKRDKTDGMSRKAVKAYRRENPGSKLKTAVTTKPSKLKKGSKSAKRRKSFCARMRGMKKSRASAKTKRNPDSPINKALRRWNCESVQDMQQLVMIAEQKVATARVEAKLRENLNKWFKEKWVRFGPDGKIRGECGGRDDSEGKPKCLPASKAHALGKKGRASAGARKRREDPNPERSGPAINVATKKKTDESQLAEKCWDTHRQVGMKKKGSRMVPNCVPKESVAEGYWQDALKKAEAGRAARKSKPFEKNPASHDKQGVYKGDKDLTGNPVPKRKKRGVAEGHGMCPECGGAMYEVSMMNEKKDACYYKVKSRYKVWPSAYASGALVKCRKKGAKNWGSKS